MREGRGLGGASRHGSPYYGDIEMAGEGDKDLVFHVPHAIAESLAFFFECD
jgi:hypothetical protein